MKRKVFFISLLIIYLFSFVPVRESIYVGGEKIFCNRIRNNYGERNAISFNSFGIDFMYSVMNVLIFDIPGHYGSSIYLFNKTKGGKMILYSTVNSFPSSNAETIGWLLGKYTGWAIRFGLLIYLILKIIKLYKGNNK